ncbi:HAMP domain-containing histidine kinase [Geobacter sp. FeAm09]|uniref:sensor histidine kinase n=1 Tax=Geobacter sp. FeAm09 TaxID=2597769 RepID=UPI0011ECCDA0|nr:HAMP domain-containing sensor histidine kinase [Geobacter sp. FeAm09]QEM69217.1 HAMP domain-containing histidine kinase [Geobacter sp. FeAm09]
MRCSLRCKFLLLFLAVSAVALSASIVLRGFIMRDFNRYRDGDAQDRVQHVIAMVEGGYEKRGAWEPAAVAEDLAWALQLDVEARLFDQAGRAVLDTAGALERLTPLMRKRVLDASSYDPDEAPGEFVPYPLFLRGEEIGRLDVRVLNPLKEAYFISSSNRFLAVSLGVLGIAALLLSLAASRRLARPVLELAAAAGDIAGGDLARRVRVMGSDEMGRLSESFNRMAAALQTQEKLRRRLLSGTAHELRTPLAIIKGELEGMMDHVLPVTREALQSLHDEAVRLTAILDGVDDLTRAEAGSMNLRPERILLRPFLAAIVGRFERLFAEKQAVLLLDCSRDLELEADPDRLSQIVINLLSNALKAVGTGGRATVVAGTGDEGIVIDVADNGRGIAAADLPHVFERFYKGPQGGLGLGLAIVKELVEGHGGRIEVHSREGEGSRFRVLLPAPRYGS